MRDDHAFDALLRRALDRKGRPAPFDVDVADRVMARVAALGPPRRREMSLRQFGRWAVAAAVVGTALTAGAIWQAPGMASVVSGYLHAAADVVGAALKLATPAGSLAETFGRVAKALVSSIQTLVQPLQPFQPLAHVMLAAIATAMLSITTIIVGRDVRSRITDKERA